MRGWLRYLVAGAQWEPVRGREPERVKRPVDLAPSVVLWRLVLILLFLTGAFEDGWYRWVARVGLLIVAWWFLDAFRERARYRTALALPPGEYDLVLAGASGRPGRVRRTLRKVFGAGLRQSLTLTRASTRAAAEPIWLVRGTQVAAADALAHRLRKVGASVEIVPAPGGETVASFRA